MADRYPIQLQAIYSELRARTQEAWLAGLVEQEGTLAAKSVAGRRYWYLRRREGGKVREIYVGPDRPGLEDQLLNLKAQARDAKEAARQRRELARLLRSGGYPTPDQRTGAVIESLARADIFRLRAVLVGTHAFRCYAAELGVRMGQQVAVTSDIDIAQFATVSLAVEDKMDPDIGAALSRVERFEPVPQLDSRQTTKWRTPDQALSVELLTPEVGPPARKSPRLPAIGAEATPLRFLDYLIFEPDSAVLIHGAGIPINIPRPERYACHKLIVAHRRARSSSDKIRKDMEQAKVLIDILSEDRPDDLRSAWLDLMARGPAWREAAEGTLAKLPEQKAILASLTRNG